MSNVVAIQSPREVALVRRTVAMDCDDAEFDMFCHVCRHLRLDPLRRQAYALVFSKDNPKYRRMAIIIGIDGYRSIAARSGDYRPDEDEPHIVYDPALKDEATNPLGIERAVVTVWKYAHGEWYPIKGVAHWSEFVPLKEAWGEDEAGNRRKSAPSLPKDSNWRKMGRVMIAKVAEAQALRRGWPDDLSGTYVEEELERAKVEDLAPSEEARLAITEERQLKLGGPAVFVDWMDGGPMDRVPVGKFADRAMAYIKAESPLTVTAWAEQNRNSLKEFWAHAPGDALEVRKAIDKRKTEIDDGKGEGGDPEAGPSDGEGVLVAGPGGGDGSPDRPGRRG